MSKIQQELLAELMDLAPWGLRLRHANLMLMGLYLRPNVGPNRPHNVARLQGRWRHQGQAAMSKLKRHDQHQRKASPSSSKRGITSWHHCHQKMRHQTGLLLFIGTSFSSFNHPAA